MECSICLSSSQGSTTTTYCGHTFCSSCLDEWLTCGDSCPYCRAILVPIVEQSEDEGYGSESDDDDDRFERFDMNRERHLYTSEFTIVPAVPGEIHWTRSYDYDHAGDIPPSYMGIIRYRGFVGDQLIFSATVGHDHPVLGNGAEIGDPRVTNELRNMRSYIRGDIALNPWGLAINYMLMFEVIFELWDMDQEGRLQYEFL